MIERTLFNADHESFRDSFRRFVDKEIAPFHEAWEEQGYVDRAVWNKAGENGFLCATLPEEYGGSGADKLYSVIQMEELARGGFSGIGYGLHSEIVAPYILHYGTAEQKQKYLPKLASGEMIGAIAMSEPAAGSDLQGVKSTAIQQADGSYLLNGSKTFITNGWHADLVIVVAKTDPAGRCEGHQPASGRARHEGLRARQAPEEAGPEGAGHGGALLRQRARARREPARRRGAAQQGLHLPDGAAALGAHPDRGDGRGLRPGRHRLDRAIHEGPQGVRPAGRVVPEHALHAGRVADRSAGGARVRRQVPRTGLRRTSSIPPPPAWPSTGPPTCSAR